MSDTVNRETFFDWAVAPVTTVSFKTETFVSRDRTEIRKPLLEVPRRLTRFRPTLEFFKEHGICEDEMPNLAGEKIVFADFLLSHKVNLSGGITLSGDVDLAMLANGFEVCVGTLSDHESAVVLSSSKDEIDLDRSLGIADGPVWVMPFTTARFPEDPSFSHLTDSVSETVFEVLHDPDERYKGDPFEPVGTVGGVPVVEFPINWAGSLESSWDRRSNVMDLGYGVVDVEHLDQTARNSFSLNISAKNRAELGQLLSFFYFAKGKFQPFFFSYSNKKFRVVGQQAIGDYAYLEVQGKSAALGISRPEDYQYVKSGDQVLRVRRSELLENGNVRFEVPLALLGDEDFLGSDFFWLLYCRLSSDDLEMEHITTKVTEVSLSMTVLPFSQPSVTFNGQPVEIGGYLLQITPLDETPSYEVSIDGYPVELYGRRLTMKGAPKIIDRDAYIQKVEKLPGYGDSYGDRYGAS